MRAKKVKYIAIHCSSGFGNRASIEKYWKTLGWNSPGYHILIDVDGTVYYLLDFEKISNGVKGFNEITINICYVGGIENIGSKKLPIWKAKDTRTIEQKCALNHCIDEAIGWLKANGNDCKNVKIQGHRDFSPDKNGNGVIESFERIKECPSFDAIAEYKNKL